MKTWTFPERRPPGDGPWTDEPDKAQWVDPATDLDCLIVRNQLGALCGYVGLPPGHPWHGEGYDDVPVTVHGGLTFAGPCQDVAEDGPGVCHVPEPGRPAGVWWLGFDCAHAGDLSPIMEAQTASIWTTVGLADQTTVYRTFDYVRGNVLALAAQCDDWDGSGRGWRASASSAFTATGPDRAASR